MRYALEIGENRLKGPKLYDSEAEARAAALEITTRDGETVHLMEIGDDGKPKPHGSAPSDMKWEPFDSESVDPALRKPV